MNGNVGVVKYSFRTFHNFSLEKQLGFFYYKSLIPSIKMLAYKGEYKLRNNIEKHFFLFFAKYLLFRKYMKLECISVRKYRNANVSERLCYTENSSVTV